MKRNIKCIVATLALMPLAACTVAQRTVLPTGPAPTVIDHTVGATASSKATAGENTATDIMEPKPDPDTSWLPSIF